MSVGDPSPYLPPPTPWEVNLEVGRSLHRIEGLLEDIKHNAKLDRDAADEKHDEIVELLAILLRAVKVNRTVTEAVSENLETVMVSQGVRT